MIRRRSMFRVVLPLYSCLCFIILALTAMAQWTSPVRRKIDAGIELATHELDGHWLTITNRCGRTLHYHVTVRSPPPGPDMCVYYPSVGFRQMDSLGSDNSVFIDVRTLEYWRDSSVYLNVKLSLFDPEELEAAKLRRPFDAEKLWIAGRQFTVHPHRITYANRSNALR